MRFCLIFVLVVLAVWVFAHEFGTVEARRGYSGVSVGRFQMPQYPNAMRAWTPPPPPPVYIPPYTAPGLYGSASTWQMPIVGYTPLPTSFGSNNQGAFWQLFRNDLVNPCGHRLGHLFC